MKASKSGHIEVVKLLLEQGGIDINTNNKNNMSALLISIVNGFTEIAELLLSHNGIIVNIEDI